MADTPDWLPAALARLARAADATANARRLLEAAAAAGLPGPTLKHSDLYFVHFVVEWRLERSDLYIVVNIDSDGYWFGDGLVTDPAAVVAAVRRWLDGEHAPAKKRGEDA